MYCESRSLTSYHHFCKVFIAQFSGGLGRCKNLVSPGKIPGGGLGAKPLEALKTQQFTVPQRGSKIPLSVDFPFSLLDY